ncbi:hydantoinase/oxoprolinase family protein [Alkalilimnicola sp. S0819]|uniref:hydantoinase/oxoprolinase family protein n=1 Tax=Alkalilimnicola sp. S0819 TaxID=2613922 RepID=UPI0012622218|nr:hydantoinase/oxoprolinase family protein [Alkalilimnicola sp. S0819]KAB7627352.1 hydantoinase/oxoprolinase family protein [Alkalilimnicola sp. S0819]MPQ16069.1 hydantoinase/oxoprolinase family protein [Alkalilimnicola sp. S0819]
MTKSDAQPNARENPHLLGVDTGGTFTDFVHYDGLRLRIHKVLSTPAAPEQAILQGIRELGLADQAIRLVHGSTVATNAVLEGKGVRTVFISNHGLGDLLTLGRQNRARLYDLQPPKTPPPVPPALCLETGGRLGADGSVVEELSDADLRKLAQAVRALQPEAVAINLLFSFLDDRFERRVAAALPEELFISRSSEVLPEYREYERGLTTWLNSYVGPLIQRYLRRLAAGARGARLAVMQSSGETADAEQAGALAVHMLLSGPAGGLAGARFIGRAAGVERLLTFDMGGTSTDVALIDGAIQLTTEGRIGEYPVAVPMVDMHTIGAGGGSIAYRDAGGMLQVGPESAGADPGPACYGRGGQRPTVTDANLVLGRLRPDAFLGGHMQLDLAAARQAVAALATELGLALEETAEGIVRLANEHMARALRVISVQRGSDPRTFTLSSFGGAGGLHVCALAESLGMDRALVPVHAGVLSALGMLAAPRGRQLSRTLRGPLADLEEAEIDAALGELRARGEAALAQEGFAASELRAQASADLRYLGQAYTLSVPWQGREATTAAFHAAHAARYGHRLREGVELVNLRLGLQGPSANLALDAPGNARVQPQHAELHGLGAVPVWPREALAAGAELAGPALITETVSTTWLAPGWHCRVDTQGNLHLKLNRT